MMEEAETAAAPAPVEEVATKPVSLSNDSPDAIKVNIADALNEQEIVKFTVHTKTGLARFAKSDFQVTRMHEEFVWLFERYTENPVNAGFIIPPPPPKPDFSQSHGKLAKLQSGDAQTPQEELES
jgi:sorting nexin-5/6/32